MIDQASVARLSAVRRMMIFSADLAVANAGRGTESAGRKAAAEWATIFLALKADNE